ncbi:MAG: hypothetical protein Q8Q08_06945 [Candidatus Omnitrophota bacterium]|nr:hypothetical protein [Candidatus Omnitrophota bacterium]
MNKAIGILIAGLLIVSGNAYAHCGKCGVGDPAPAAQEDMMGKKLDMMTKELKLSDEQKGKVEAILKEKMEKKQQIMAQKKEAMDALHADFKAKLQGVLSEEQMKSWETMKDKCPMCKDGKMCEMCKGKMKGHCPDCKDGKMCEMCMLKKKNKKMGDDHAHPEDSKK